MPDEGSPDEVEECEKDTRTLLFLLLTRRRRPIKACWARRSLDMWGLIGFLKTSRAAWVEGFVGRGVEGGSAEAVWTDLMLGRPRELPRQDSRLNTGIVVKRFGRDATDAVL